MSTTLAYAGPERRRARPSPVVVSLAVTTFAGIVFATLCPIGLRPHLGSADVERFGAWFALGTLVQLAAGRRATSAMVVVALAAIGLEYAQYLAPTRHAQLSDAMIKMLGGVCGGVAGQLMFPVKRWLAQALRPADRAAPWAPEAL